MKKGIYFLSCISLLMYQSELAKWIEQTGFVSELVTFTSQKEDKEMTEKLLKDLYRQVNQAMVEKDTVKLESLLKADTVLIHMTGYSQPVSEWLNQIETEEMRYYSWQEQAIKGLVIDENRASLIGQSLVTARIWGMGPTTWRLQIHMFFEKINGKWIIVKQVASTY